MFNYNQYIPQPAFGFVHFELFNRNKKVVLKTPSINEKLNSRIIEMQYTRNMANRANQLTFKLFDETWGELEDDIIEIYRDDDSRLLLKYGWIGNDGEIYESQYYSLSLTHIRPEFRIDGLILTFDAISNVDDFFQNKFKYNTFALKEFACRHLPYLNQYLKMDHKTSKVNADLIERSPVSPSDVVKAFAIFKKFDYDIDETHIVLHHWSHTKTIRQPWVPPMNDVTIGSYIKDEILPISCGRNNKPGYYFWVEDGEERPKIIFKQMKESDDVLKYIYLREENSEVISFSPVLLGKFASLKTPSESMQYVDLQTGHKKIILKHAERVNCGGNNHLPIDKIGGNYVTLKKRDNDTIPEKEKIAKNTHNIKDQHHTLEMSEIKTAHSMIYDMNTTFEAELRIICNPKLNPYATIYVEVPKPNGELHYASGQYRITEITDRYVNGVLESTIKLIRNSLLTQSQQVVKD